MTFAETYVRVSCVYRCVYCDSFTDEEDWGRVVLTIILIDLRDYE